MGSDPQSYLEYLHRPVRELEIQVTTLLTEIEKLTATKESLQWKVDMLRQYLLYLRDGVDFREISCPPLEASGPARYVVDRALEALEALE